MWTALVVIVTITFILWVNLWESRRKKRRRDTLRYGNGYWTWTDFDGRSRRSRTKPTSPGGDWYDDGGSDWGCDGGDGGD